MRAARDQTYRQFSEWLLRIGAGDEPHDDDDQVILPQDIIAESMENIINFVYLATQPDMQILCKIMGTCQIVVA